MGCFSSKEASPAAQKSSSAGSGPLSEASPVSGRKSTESRTPFGFTYTLKEKLGKGQYAIVYRAVDRAGKEYAVKCIKKAPLTPEDIEALEVEVKAMELLRTHPNFVRYYDFYEEKDYYYLILEIITGGELFDRIVNKARYTEREARRVLYQLASGIAFAHSRGIAHRDLKPENILLASREDDTSLKLADLGFAKVLHNPKQLMTTPCGTPGYVAPEVISGNPYTLSCDVWSMGVIFYILLCGYPPFHDEDQEVMFQKIRAGAYTLDPADWNAVSPQCKDLVRRILVVDPAQRLTAAQVLAHPWMTQKDENVPDVELGAAIAQLKRFNARRRLKAAMNMVRATVRTKMLLAAKASIAAKKAGATDEEAQEAFMKAAAAPGPIAPRFAETASAAAGVGTLSPIAARKAHLQHGGGGSTVIMPPPLPYAPASPGAYGTAAPRGTGAAPAGGVQFRVASIARPPSGGAVSGPIHG